MRATDTELLIKIKSIEQELISDGKKMSEKTYRDKMKEMNAYTKIFLYPYKNNSYEDIVTECC
jgi:hypothetical protein